MAVNITLPERLAQRLEAIARCEQRPVADVVETLLDQYETQSPVEQEPDWGLVLGIGDENVTDMSTSVRETMQAYLQRKYGRSD